MAAVAILDGALAGGASTAWVAVPASALYTVQFNGTGSEDLTFAVSNDGANAMSANGLISNISGGATIDRILQVSKPVAFMQVTNNRASSVTAKVYAQAAP